MDKAYSPRDLEGRLYAQWESAGYFAPGGRGDPFCIMIPPPNVTGTLHMGHAFQDTIMDALTRQMRMSGRNTLWQAGMDHAGIATQMVVERQLNAAGKTRHDLGREAFVARAWQWKAESGGTISRQLRRLGASLDWSRERFTLDPELSGAVTEVFVRLHEEGLIYRGKRLVNWDPVLHTALSDLEVLSEEEAGHLWHIRYPLDDGSGYMVVATTRPETLLGDTAVAVHPDDERYQQRIGRQLRLPLTERLIPVIADSYVDPAFGSGSVKITPAHDFNDYEVGERHGLEKINILDPSARLNDNVPAKYRGLDRCAARKLVLADLEALGLIERTEAHTYAVPRGDRSGAVLEPYLTDQWYVKVAPLAAAAIAAVEDGRIRFVPENWTRTYYEWMRNIKDWCVSRQLWWGHRIPAWYDATGKVYVGRNIDAVRERYGLAPGLALTQDEDVLDTWFSSALWPFSTLGWPQRTPDLATFYPSSVLVTGFDIIFFWVARMIMMGLKFMGDVPFREVYVHGLIRDHDGQKMSKSKGNVIDPLDIVDGIDLEALVKKRTTGLMQPHLARAIEKATRKEFPGGIESHGTDALRFTFAALATHSRDIRFDLARVAGYRNFCNKLWNAARYVTLVSADQDCGLTGEIELSAADRWIRSRCSHATTEAARGFTQYRFDLAAQALYEFTWYEFCDWYLELSKPVLQAPATSAAAVRGTRQTLLLVLETVLRLLHPIMPFITEEIWTRIAPLAGKRGPTIMLEPYPLAADYPRDTGAENEMRWVMDFILGVRQIRGAMDIAPSKRFEVLLADAGERDLELLQAHGAYLQRLAQVSGIRALATGERAPQSATALLGELKILVPMAGLIDVAAERERLGKRATKARAELARCQGKLGNEKFVANAPPEVIAQERGRVASFERELAQIESQLQLLADLERGSSHG